MKDDPYENFRAALRDLDRALRSAWEPPIKRLLLALTRITNRGGR